jgi:hypothetical protein
VQPVFVLQVIAFLHGKCQHNSLTLRQSLCLRVDIIGTSLQEETQVRQDLLRKMKFEVRLERLPRSA